MTDKTNLAILAPVRSIGGRAGTHNVDWSACGLAHAYGIPGEDHDQSRIISQRPDQWVRSSYPRLKLLRVGT